MNHKHQNILMNGKSIWTSVTKLIKVVKLKILGLTFIIGQGNLVDLHSQSPTAFMFCSHG